jgi:hypothetical protein
LPPSGPQREQERQVQVTRRILVGAPLKAALDAAAERSPIILSNTDGKPRTSEGFRASWRKACAAAGCSLRSRCWRR